MKKGINHSQKTSEISSEQLLVWARRIEVQRAQNMFREPTKASREFDNARKHEHKNSTPDRTKENEGKVLANYQYGRNAYKEDAQNMTRNAQDMER